jgi:long-subunit acyl-CoA synthetase (AMP-forming)
VLYTSGTTSRPKIVPLTHSNICASACNHRVALDLDESDRCLNVMPLFHTNRGGEKILPRQVVFIDEIPIWGSGDL